MSLLFDKDTDSYFFECPHCKDGVQVLRKDVNCKVFRHGIHKKNLKQIDPHLPEEECNRLVEKKKIYGCSRPFLINVEKMIVEKCGYI